MPPRPERRTVIGVFPCFGARSGVSAYFRASAPRASYRYRRISLLLRPERRTGVSDRIGIFPCFCVPSRVPAYQRISLLLRPERRTGVSSAYFHASAPRAAYRRIGVFHRLPPPGAVLAHCRISLLHDPPGAGTSEHCRSGTAYRRFPSLRPSERRIGVFPRRSAYRRTGVSAYRRKAVLGHYLCPRWHFNASLSGGFTGEPLVGFMPLRPRVPACPCAFQTEIGVALSSYSPRQVDIIIDYGFGYIIIRPRSNRNMPTPQLFIYPLYTPNIFLPSYHTKPKS